MSKNVLMKEQISAGQYENIYPETKAELVKANSGVTAEQHINDIEKHVTVAERTAWTNKVNNTEKGAANGVATLDGSGKIPSSQLPAIAVPIATSTMVGGVKSGTDITVDASGNVSVNDDSHNHVVANIDNLQTALDEKLNKSGGAMTGDLTLKGDPTQALHAATKQYVDAIAQGLNIKYSVRAATTANITLSGTQSIDGVAVIAGDRVLVKNQNAASENGIYVVKSGAWTRAEDVNTSEELRSAFTFVEEGSINQDSGWYMNANAPITLGTTSITWVQFSGAGQITAGTGLVKSGNTLSIETGGVTDTMLGNRVVDQAISAAFSNTGSITQLLSWIVKSLKAATGKTNWYDTPDTTLAATKSHIDAVSAHGATSSATASRMVTRDSAGRTKMASPAADDDVATLGTVKNQVVVASVQPTNQPIGGIWLQVL